MATWDEVGDLLRVSGWDRLSATAWSWDVPIDGGPRMHRLFVSLERIEPDMDILKVASPFARRNEIDADAVVRNFGELLAGAIGYLPHGPSGEGFLVLSTTVPLALVDLSDPAAFLVWLAVVATAAHRSARTMSSSLVAPDFRRGGQPDGNGTTPPPPTRTTAPAPAEPPPSPPAPDVFAPLGWQQEQAGDHAAAEATYRQGHEAGEAASSSALGRFLASRGRFDEAEAALRTAADAGFAEAWYNLSILLESARHDLAGAEAALRRAAELGYVSAWFNLGALLRERGDLAAAEDCWQRAVDSGDAAGAYNLGLLRDQRGDKVGAEAAWRRGDELGAVESTAALARLLEQRGDPATAEALYRKADQGGHPDGAYGLGVVFYDRGDVAGALAAFERAAQLGHAGAPEILKILRGEQ